MHAYFGVNGVGWETHDSLRNKRRRMTICIYVLFTLLQNTHVYISVAWVSDGGVLLRFRGRKKWTTLRKGICTINAV